MQKHQTARPAPPLPHTHNPRAKTAPAHLFVVRKLSKQRSLFNLSPPIGPQVLEVVLCLLLAALRCPARSEVFMCQWALFSREAELNINSPRRTILQEAEDLRGKENCPVRNTKHKLTVFVRRLTEAGMFSSRRGREVYFRVRHYIHTAKINTRQNNSYPSFHHNNIVISATAGEYHNKMLHKQTATCYPTLFVRL